MMAIVSFLTGKFSLSLLWYIFYYAVITVLIGFYVSFTLWAFQMLLYIYNMVDSLLNLISSSNSSEVGAQIFGLLSCMGVTEGINAGMPILLSAVSTVLFSFLYAYMKDFYFFIISVVKGLKPA